MMELQAGSAVYYQASIIRESRTEIRVLFPGAQRPLRAARCCPRRAARADGGLPACTSAWVAWPGRHAAGAQLTSLRASASAETKKMRERREWVDKRSSRIWRGRMESRYWRYIKGSGGCPARVGVSFQPGTEGWAQG